MSLIIIILITVRPPYELGVEGREQMRWWWCTHTHTWTMRASWDGMRWDGMGWDEWMPLYEVDVLHKCTIMHSAYSTSLRCTVQYSTVWFCNSCNIQLTATPPESGPGTILYSTILYDVQLDSAGKRLVRGALRVWGGECGFCLLWL